MVTSSTAKMKIKHFLFSLNIIFHLFFPNANKWVNSRELIEMYEGLAGGSKWPGMTDISDIMTWGDTRTCHHCVMSGHATPWQRPTWKYFQSASHQSENAPPAHKCIDNEILKSSTFIELASHNLSLNDDNIPVSSSQSEKITVLRYQYEAILLLPPLCCHPSPACCLWSPSWARAGDQSSGLFCTNCFILTAAQWPSQTFTITVIRCTTLKIIWR